MIRPNHARPAGDRHVERGLEHTRRLGESRPHGQFTAEWYAEAANVGDLTALAALTLAQSPRA